MASASSAADAVLVRTARRCGGCDAREDAAVEALLQWQKVGDLLIAASLLSIPLELLYFSTVAALAPLRRALLQLGTFVVMCGVTHLLNALAYDRPGNRRVLLLLTSAKALGALATTAAAVSLPIFFPRLLRIKARESLLRAKARQLDRDLAAVRRRDDAVSRVARAVTRHVRDSAVDARAVLDNTLRQLAAALDVHNCAVWTPVVAAPASGGGGMLQLTHQLLPSDDADKVLDGRSGTRAISVRHPDVDVVMASKDARVLKPGSVLEAVSGGGGGMPPAGSPTTAAIRIRDFHGGAAGNSSSEPTSYAILVLVRRANDEHRSPPARWSRHDLEIVEAVAEHVAVALAHAAALEESELLRRMLSEQRAALVHAKGELDAATAARNAARGAMRDAVARPAHAVVGLVSVMQQPAPAEADAPGLCLELRLAVDAIARTSALLTLSTMDAGGDQPPPPGPAMAARRPFELRSLVRDAASVGGCLAGCHGLGFSHWLEANSLPEWVVGDDKRVFHLLLHMVGVVLSRGHRHVAGGVLSFSASSCNSIAGDDQDRILVGERAKISGGNHVFVKFQVGITRTGGSDPAGSLLPSSCLPSSSGYTPDFGGPDMWLSTAVCKRIAKMMNGNMWCASESKGETTMTLLLRLQQPLNPHAPGSSGTYRIVPSPRTLAQHHHFNGLRIILADTDATSMEVTRKLLERLGCEVVPAPSPADCLSLLQGSAGEPPFQLVVLDLDGGGHGGAAAMDGLEVAVRIRELSDACWLLVLVAVATSDGVYDRVRDMCRRAGVNGLIQKPVTLTALGAQLQRILENN
ncbi:hypothetical protein HU200_006346 [Digitaria exilis]|uniref:histidine kinase n=1 Tax=Digitaria exilis TaxID=1010633 RepID=A0A835FPR6_9POAL|nr:hypothetical protein HU200_006346 [Digitaria exilis]